MRARHCVACRLPIDDEDNPSHTRDGWLCSRCSGDDDERRRYSRAGIWSLAEPDTWTLEEYKRWNAV